MLSQIVMKVVAETDRFRVSTDELSSENENH